MQSHLSHMTSLTLSLNPRLRVLPKSMTLIPHHSFKTFSHNPQIHSQSPKKSMEELFFRIASGFINSAKSKSRESVPMFDEVEKKLNLKWGGYFGSIKKDQIANLVEELVDGGVVWEQRVKDIEAERDLKSVSSPGFSFSAAGLLFPYHLGVAQLLIEKGYIKDTTPLAGASAGSIVCAAIVSGYSMHEALKATKILAEDCRLNGTAFRLGAVLRDVLVNFLPDDIHIRSNGRVRVAVTQVLWRPRGLLVDKFDSKEDLINAVITSSFIPGYLALRPATMFRNRLCIDGGLTLFIPPTRAAHTIRVCAFPASQLGSEGIGISPHLNPENRAGPRELFNWALEPASNSVLDRLFELGYLDAFVWSEKNPLEIVSS